MVERRAILRIIDANFNRAQEGLRVCEEVARFLFNNKASTMAIKTLRHALSKTISDSRFPILELVKTRDALGDVGKNLDLPTNKRDSMLSLFYANSQRVKESLRVLEEFLKIFDHKISTKIQKLRFKFYTIEKDNIQKLHALSCFR